MPRSVPYALWEPIEEELDSLEVIDEVTNSEWQPLLVAVPKPDRLRGDFVSVCGSLPLAITLAGGKKFTKLDLTQAYLQ